MAVILGTLFLGISFFATEIGAVPSEAETVISQLARTAFGGRNLIYLALISATTLILIMAANTAFADFPRLSALQAADRFLPRQFTYRGSRLVFSWGIVTLALVASFLVFIFQASVTGLIPLYAIGVFLSFTLSQAGMARRWRKIGALAPEEEVRERGSVLRFEPGWRWKMLVNAFGAVCTFVVMMIFAVTKFRDGAWLILVVIPLLVSVFYAIHRHYRSLAQQLSLDHEEIYPHFSRQRVILPIAGVHQGTLAALRYAMSLSKNVTAVHVAVDDAEVEKIRSRWPSWAKSVPLVIIPSPYRELMQPMLAYINEIVEQSPPDEAITVVVPQFVTNRFWTNALHMQTATWLRRALLHREGVVVIDVPYQVD
jgi:hypothetical protein